MSLDNIRIDSLMPLSKSKYKGRRRGKRWLFKKIHAIVDLQRDATACVILLYRPLKNSQGNAAEQNNKP